MVSIKRGVKIIAKLEFLKIVEAMAEPIIAAAMLNEIEKNPIEVRGYGESFIIKAVKVCRPGV